MSVRSDIVWGEQGNTEKCAMKLRIMFADFCWDVGLWD